MAPQRDSDEVQTFIGETVEEVLADVRKTLGRDAEVLEANKLRKGGVGGFFAKESVEVKARRKAPAGPLPPGIDEALFDRAAKHVADSVGASSGGAADPSSAALLGLADKVSAAESTKAPAAPAAPAAPTAAAAPAPAAPVAPVAHSMPTPVEPASAPAAAAAPAPAAPAAPAPRIRPLLPPASFEPMGTEAMPRLSTEGGAFNEVLQRIATDAGAQIADAVNGDAATAGSRPPRALKPVGPQARSRAEVVAQRHDSSLPDIHQSPTGSATGMSLRDNLLGAAPSAPSAPTPPATTSVEPVEVSVSTPAEPASGGDGSRMPSLTDLISPPSSSATEQGDRTARLLSWLQRDNLPKTTVLTALRGLPTTPALPETTGVVVVVVGKRQEALRLCKRLAKDFDPEQVVLASKSYKGSSIPQAKRIIDVTDATRDRASWRRRENPTFVAVEAPTAVGHGTLAWTSDIVAELEAHQVIGISAADRKTEDIAVWAERIGGVDALALTGLEDTSTPYAVLALEIPIAWLDDVKATPGAWANILLEERTR